MDARRVIAAAVAAMLLCGSGAPAVVGAAGEETSLGATVGQQRSGAALVAVTERGSPVADATVTVTVSPASDADGYGGEGTFATDANGTVLLPPPDEPVTVDVTVANGGEALTETVELVPLAVDVDRRADGAATATVTAYGAPVGNATVAVAADGTYAGAGSHTTGANGSVALPAPAETTDVAVTADADGPTAGTTATLYDSDLDVAVDGATEGTPAVRVSRNGSAVGGASVTVEAAGNYTGAGTYETGPNGSVALPAPGETLTATVIAVDGNESAARTATLKSTTGARMSLGMRVSSFVHGLLGDDSTGGIGTEVSAWVHANGPGEGDGANGVETKRGGSGAGTERNGSGAAGTRSGGSGANRGGGNEDGATGERKALAAVAGDDHAALADRIGSPARGEAVGRSFSYRRTIAFFASAERRRVAEDRARRAPAPSAASEPFSGV